MGHPGRVRKSTTEVKQEALAGLYAQSVAWAERICSVKPEISDHGAVLSEKVYNIPRVFR
jgi:hypothetical protein